MDNHDETTCIELYLPFWEFPGVYLIRHEADFLPNLLGRHAIEQ